MKRFLLLGIPLALFSLPCRADVLTSGIVLERYCNDANAQAKNADWLECGYLVDSINQTIILVAYSAYLEDHPPLNPTQVQDGEQQFLKFLKYCEPGTVSVTQEALVVSKYLHDHPEHLDEGASWNVIAAFQQAWPCLK